MRLFAALCRKKMPNGHIHRGKNRLVPPVTPDQKARLRLDFEIEERNMFFLRHPYLTKEQSEGHAKALNKEAKRLEVFRNKVKPFYDNVKIEDRLAHLRHTESWD